ncbi:hydrogenase [Anaerosporomusa subterranea]|uniref:Hydrogenase n=2 Tax=Anaerosporomusa subterranea TaxID=1794912 RepID=A0A154BLC8_ANASB|nr:hydrogenase [Anaerosporomusa subterranea]
MITRREFISLCMSATAAVSLADLIAPVVREALAAGQVNRPPVIWLELGSCTGNSISLDNAVNPSLHQLLREVIDLRYHWTFQVAQGDDATRAIFDTVEQDAGRYWLIIEGAPMTAEGGRYNYVFFKDGQLVTGLDALKMLAAQAKHVIAVGGCACFGGPAAAHPNPGGAKGVWDIIKSPPVINIPGCPAHPDWITGTLSHLAMYGLPELDAYHRPVVFFGKTIHDLCQRRQQFEDGIFAQFPGDPGCLLKVGCKGPVTHADCPLRQWNHYVNWPVKAGAGCIGCASPDFPDLMMPFYEHLPNVYTGSVKTNVKRLGKFVTLAGIGAVAAHLAVGVATGRIKRHWLDGTKPLPAAPPENETQRRRDQEEQEKKCIAKAKTQNRKLTKPKETWVGRLVRVVRSGGKDED